MRLDRVRAALGGADPPSAVLLLGPGSHQALLDSCEPRPGVPVVTYGELTPDIVRAIRAMSLKAPLGVRWTQVVIWSDGATAQAQAALLKLLEEPPPTIRFVLCATVAPADTVTSRCHIYRWGEADLAAEESACALVLEALKAAAASDQAALVRVFRDWGDAEHMALADWAVECVCGRWRRFSREDALLAPYQARKLLRAMTSAARPKLADRAALEEVSNG